jgi:hypothetical protein
MIGSQLHTVRERVAAAHDALVGWQQDDGGFPLLRWTPGGPCVEDDRLFATAAIVLAVGERLRGDPLRAALALLRRRQGEDGLWRFDAAAQLPPDADDTAHALAALWRFAPATERPNPADFARLAAFVRPDGRIATWMASGQLGATATDDAVVVANVLYAMALSQPATARRWLTGWLRRSRTGGAGMAGVPYYLHAETVWYAWGRARAALGLDEPADVPALLAAPGGSPLRCALALSSGSAPRDDLVAELLRSQDTDGGWPAEPWFRAPGAVFGSAALTTALALEGLLRWQRQAGPGPG